MLELYKNNLCVQIKWDWILYLGNYKQCVQSHLCVTLEDCMGYMTFLGCAGPCAGRDRTGSILGPLLVNALSVTTNNCGDQKRFLKCLNLPHGE